MLAVAFGDGGGQFAFGVVAVPEADGHPVVDHDDGLEGDRDGVGVVVVAVERGQVLAQPPCPAFMADRAEGDAVALALGEEVAAESEHVRPAVQVQRLVLGQLAECAGVSIIDRWWPVRSRCATWTS